MPQLFWIFLGCMGHLFWRQFLYDPLLWLLTADLLNFIFISHSTPWAVNSFLLADDWLQCRCPNPIIFLCGLYGAFYFEGKSFVRVCCGGLQQNITFYLHFPLYPTWGIPGYAAIAILFAHPITRNVPQHTSKYPTEIFRKGLYCATFIPHPVSYNIDSLSHAFLKKSGSTSLCLTWYRARTCYHWIAHLAEKNHCCTPHNW